MSVALFVLLCAAAALAQQIDFLAPRDDASYTTDGQIAVQIKQTLPFAATDNTFQIRFRCEIFFRFFFLSCVSSLLTPRAQAVQGADWRLL